MDYVRRVADGAAGIFKGLPELSPNARAMLNKAWPWLAVIFGVLQLLTAWRLWNFLQRMDQLNDRANSLALSIIGEITEISAVERTLIFIALVLLGTSAVVAILAWTELRRYNRRGWELLFAALMLNLVYGVTALFIEGRGLATLFFVMVASAIGFYLLYQSRSKFTKRAK